MLAAIEGIVLTWWAQKLYQVWSRLYSFLVAIRLPWQASNGNVVNDAADVNPVERKNVRGPIRRPRDRHQQAAIDARNDYKTVCCCNQMTESFKIARSCIRFSEPYIGHGDILLKFFGCFVIARNSF